MNRSTGRKTVRLTVQQWGNSLAVCIPAAIARKVRFIVYRERPQKLTLKQKLAAFDIEKHGGEV